jgi:hypothetical protein
VALTLSLAFISCALFWRHAYYQSKKQEAMQFCEELAPLVEHFGQENGHCPATIDATWLQGKHLPNLVKLTDFYSCQGDRFDLRFRNPGDFWNDIWDYQCAGKCTWLNYD